MKTEELQGAALDWAVECLENNRSPESTASEEDYSPSTKWSQGGVIIEHCGISIKWISASEWQASDLDYTVCFGPTPLIAAMRCYVASKLGDEVEIPEGLK